MIVKLNVKTLKVELVSSSHLSAVEKTSANLVPVLRITIVLTTNQNWDECQRGGVQYIYMKWNNGKTSSEKVTSIFQSLLLE